MSIKRNDSIKSRSIQRRKFVKTIGATGIASGLGGCLGDSGRDSSSSGRSIEMMALDEWINVQEELNALFHEQGMSEDIIIEMKSGGQETDDQQAQYQQWLSAGLSTPDIMCFDSGWTIPFIVRDQLLNLEKTLPQELLDRVHNDYFEASVNSASGTNGDLYAFPIFPDFPTIQYRKDLVQDAGYNWEQYATEPMSWEQFSNELKDIYEQSDVEFGYTTQHVAAEQLSCCVFNEYLSSHGGAFFGDPAENLFQNIGDRPVTVNDAEVIRSLEMVRTFIHGSNAPHTLDDYSGAFTPQAASQWNTEEARAPFTNGNAVASRNWPYAIAISGTEDNLGEDQGVMPMPYGVPEGEGNYSGTGGSIAALGGWHIGVNPNSEKIDAVIEMLHAMQTDEAQKGIFGLTGHMPPDPEVLADSTEVDVVGRHVETLSYAGQHTMARPVTVLWPQEADAIEQATNQALRSGGNPKEQMDQLKKRLTTIENDFEG